MMAESVLLINKEYQHQKNPAKGAFLWKKKVFHTQYVLESVYCAENRIGISQSLIICY